MKLNEQFKLEGKTEVTIKHAPEELTDEDLLEMLNAGLIEFTILDDHLANFWKQVLPKITLHPDIALRSGGEISMGNPEGQSSVNERTKSVYSVSWQGNNVWKRDLPEIFKNNEICKECCFRHRTREIF